MFKRFAVSLLCLAGIGSPAGAQEQERICLLPLGADRAAVEEQAVLLSMLEENFKSGGGISVVGPEEFRAGLLGEEAAGGEGRTELEALLKAAQKAYQFLDIDKARQALSEARALLPEIEADIAGTDLTPRLHLLEAQVALLAQKPESALRSMEMAILLNPGIEVTDEHYPPDVVEVFQSAKKRLDRKAKARLLLTSEPTGATVYLEGVERGETPLALSLPRGNYHFTMRLAGYVERSLKVGIAAGNRKKIHVVLEKEVSVGTDSAKVLKRLDRGTNWKGFSQDEVARLTKAAKAFGCTYIFASRSEGEDVSKAWIVDVSTSKALSRSWKFHGAGFYDEKEIQEAARDIAMIAVADIGPESSGTKESESKPGPGSALMGSQTGFEQGLGGEEPGAQGTKWYESWWFWTIVGGVAVAGTVAGVTAWALWPENQKASGTIFIRRGAY